MKTIKEQFITELVTNLNEACRTHDWTYNYSDDSRAWRAGNQNSQLISQMRAEMKARGLEDKATEIYNKFRPDMV